MIASTCGGSNLWLWGYRVADQSLQLLDAHGRRAKQQVNEAIALFHGYEIPVISGTPYKRPYLKH